MTEEVFEQVGALHPAPTGRNFGGMESQSAVVWDGDALRWGPDAVDYAINQALWLLGVAAADGKDEFDMIGLGQHRHTDQWAG